MGPGDERRPGRIGGWRSWAGRICPVPVRRVAAGPLAIDGSHGLDGIGAPGLRERDSVGAYLVRAGLALLAWLVPWRPGPPLAEACRPPRAPARHPGRRRCAVTPRGTCPPASSRA